MQKSVSDSSILQGCLVLLLPLVSVVSSYAIISVLLATWMPKRWRNWDGRRIGHNSL